MTIISGRSLKFHALETEYCQFDINFAVECVCISFSKILTFINSRNHECPPFKSSSLEIENMSMFLLSSSIHLIVFYHECHSLIGYATPYLFCDG